MVLKPSEKSPLTAIRTSGMDFTGNWEKDLAAAGVDGADPDVYYAT